MASYFQFQINRNSRRFRRTIHVWKIWLLNYSQRHIYGGWQKLGNARWVFIAWVLVVVVSLLGFWQQNSSINSHYLTQAPASGGIYAEALAGTVKGVNPLFPDNSATSDVTAVVFSGLTKVDSDRKIVGDLASSWEVSADKKSYVFNLRKNLKWQDGTPLNAEDVAFTINRIQNPDTRSPLAGNWSGVKYEVLDQNTIRLNLPNSYGPFLFNTTVGIIPKHLLEKVRPALLKTYEFNQRPVGSGPFILREIKDGQDEIILDSFKDFYQGRPYLDQLRFVQYQSSDDFLDGYLKKQVNGFAIAKPELEKQAKQVDDLTIHNLSLPAYGALFFNMRSPAVSDIRIRQALAFATDKNSIVTNQLDGRGTKINYPILAGYSGFDSTAVRYDYNQEKAKELLAGINPEQLKNTRLRIVTVKGSVYEEIANSVRQMWADIGIQSDIIAVPLDELQQNYIRPRNYDVLLYGQSLGIDSDVYAYWHSSQATDPGSNLSQYANPEADKFLETGRTAKDPVYKNSRFSLFLQLWSKDVPAIILYTPFYNYAQNNAVGGLSADKLVEPSNRFLDIQKWYIQTREATKASVN